MTGREKLKYSTFCGGCNSFTPTYVLKKDGIKQCMMCAAEKPKEAALEITAEILFEEHDENDPA